MFAGRHDVYRIRRKERVDGRWPAGSRGLLDLPDDMFLHTRRPTALALLVLCIVV